MWESLNIWEQHSAAQNYMHEEIKSRLNSGNACYHSVYSLWSSRLLSRNVKVTKYNTIIVPVVLHGCETGYLTVREQHGLRGFENRVLRRIFGPKRDDVMGEWRKLHNGELHNLLSSPNTTPDQIKKNEVGGACGTHGMKEKCTRFWWERPKERDRSEDRGVDGCTKTKWILRSLAGRMWPGFTWPRIGAGGLL
jgi:hypothetical protein